MEQKEKKQQVNQNPPSEGSIDIQEILDHSGVKVKEFASLYKDSMEEIKDSNSELISTIGSLGKLGLSFHPLTMSLVEFGDTFEEKLKDVTTAQEKIENFGKAVVETNTAMLKYAVTQKTLSFGLNQLATKKMNPEGFLGRNTKKAAHFLGGETLQESMNPALKTSAKWAASNTKAVAFAGKTLGGISKALSSPLLTTIAVAHEAFIKLYSEPLKYADELLKKQKELQTAISSSVGNTGDIYSASHLSKTLTGQVMQQTGMRRDEAMDHVKYTTEHSALRSENTAEIINLAKQASKNNNTDIKDEISKLTNTLNTQLLGATPEEQSQALSKVSIYSQDVSDPLTKGFWHKKDEADAEFSKGAQRVSTDRFNWGNAKGRMFSNYSYAENPLEEFQKKMAGGYKQGSLWEQFKETTPIKMAGDTAGDIYSGAANFVKKGIYSSTKSKAYDLEEKIRDRAAGEAERKRDESKGISPIDIAFKGAIQHGALGNIFNMLGMQVETPSSLKRLGVDLSHIIGSDKARGYSDTQSQRYVTNQQDSHEAGRYAIEQLDDRMEIKAKELEQAQANLDVMKKQATIAQETGKGTISREKFETAQKRATELKLKYGKGGDLSETERAELRESTDVMRTHGEQAALYEKLKQVNPEAYKNIQKKLEDPNSAESKHTEAKKTISEYEEKKGKGKLTPEDEQKYKSAQEVIKDPKNTPGYAKGVELQQRELDAKKAEYEKEAAKKKEVEESQLAAKAGDPVAQAKIKSDAAHVEKAERELRKRTQEAETTILQSEEIIKTGGPAAVVEKAKRDRDKAKREKYAAESQLYGDPEIRKELEEKQKKLSEDKDEKGNAKSSDQKKKEQKDVDNLLKKLKDSGVISAQKQTLALAQKAEYQNWANSNEVIDQKRQIQHKGNEVSVSQAFLSGDISKEETEKYQKQMADPNFKLNPMAQQRLKEELQLKSQEKNIEALKKGTDLDIAYKPITDSHKQQGLQRQVMQAMGSGTLSEGQAGRLYKLTEDPNIATDKTKQTQLLKHLQVRQQIRENTNENIQAATFGIKKETYKQKMNLEMEIGQRDGWLNSPIGGDKTKTGGADTTALKQIFESGNALAQQAASEQIDIRKEAFEKEKQLTLQYAKFKIDHIKESSEQEIAISKSEVYGGDRQEGYKVESVTNRMNLHEEKTNIDKMEREGKRYTTEKEVTERRQAYDDKAFDRGVKNELIGILGGQTPEALQKVQQFKDLKERVKRQKEDKTAREAKKEEVKKQDTETLDKVTKTRELMGNVKDASGIFLSDNNVVKSEAGRKKLIETFKEGMPAALRQKDTAKVAEYKKSMTEMIDTQDKMEQTKLAVQTSERKIRSDSIDKQLSKYDELAGGPDGKGRNTQEYYAGKSELLKEKMNIQLDQGDTEGAKKTKQEYEENYKKLDNKHQNAIGDSQKQTVLKIEESNKILNSILKALGGEETEKEKADKETEKDVGEDSSSSSFAAAVAQFTQGTTITVNVGGSATGKIGGGAAPY